MLPCRAYVQTAFSVLVPFLMRHLLPRRGPFPSTAFAHAAHQLQFPFLLLLGPPMSPPITHRPRHQRQRHGHSPVHRRVSDPASLTAHSRNGTVRPALHPCALHRARRAHAAPHPSYELPSDLAQFSNLTHLDIGDNRLEIAAPEFMCTASVAIQLRRAAAYRRADTRARCLPTCAWMPTTFL
jgi:hypothetical protein